MQHIDASKVDREIRSIAILRAAVMMDEAQEQDHKWSVLLARALAQLAETMWPGLEEDDEMD